MKYITKLSTTLFTNQNVLILSLDWSVGPSVSDTQMNSEAMTHSIEMFSGVAGQVWQRNHILAGCPDPIDKAAIFEGWGGEWKGIGWSSVKYSNSVALVMLKQLNLSMSCVEQ